MPTIVFITHNGIERRIEAPEGQTIKDAALANGVHEIVGDCGGFCNCGTCHGFIDPAWLDRLPPKSEIEDQMLEGTVCPAQENSRLCCQLPMSDALDGVIVRLPPSQI